jgi:hypothetical protein
MKVYEIKRTPGGVRCQVRRLSPPDEMVYDLSHVVHHSPTGFEMGYAGSGPADLALSILADYFGERPTKKQLYHGDVKCWVLHQQFKFEFVAKMNRQEAQVTEAEIDDFVKRNSARLEQWEAYRA